jgi:endoglucanase
MKLGLCMLLLWLSLGAAGRADVPAARLDTLSRGVNLITVFTPAPLPIIDSGLHTIRQAGLRHVRIFVDPAWVLRDAANPSNRLQQVVKAAVADHLGVILCMGSSADPMDDKATPAVVREWTEAWQLLAGHYAHAFPPDMIFFELANEPTMDPKRWNAVQDELLAAVRKVAPDNTVLLAGSPYSTAWALAPLNPSTDGDVAYAIHLYQPMPFTHQGAQWDSRFTAISGLQYPPDPANVQAVMRDVPPNVQKELAAYEKSGADAMVADLAMARKMADERHLHIVVTEFGVYRTAPPASRARWLAQAVHTMQADGFGWTVWEYDGGFGIKPDLNACTAVAHALGLHCAL